ncbi:PaaI family thioesterase [Carboxylicivirga sediminis]|uniref:PaaI family thioesterase n=1 Tax=Carboxylicivirga sediminis TaxID=2006564 RepID=A0A941F722_9BACT|nr:PaaI family thioesterase [Carboxylicivirga sediminis]MBR8537933.1 PaaI family thioesterase [Carboxylicivirga sediminis]
MKKIVNPFASEKGSDYHCFGCSKANSNGLQLSFYSDGDKLFANWLPQRAFEGYTNVVHGGIQATLMDEIASWYVYALLDTAGVTSAMEVKYHKPLYMTNGEVQIVAELKEKNRRSAIIDTKIYNASGLLCSSALVEYYLFPSNVARTKYKYPGKEKFWE